MINKINLSRFSRFSPMPIVHWWRSSYFYQVFIVRIRRFSVPVRMLCGMLYGLSYILFIAALVWFIGSFDAVLELEQMDKATGVVEKVRQAARTSCGDNLYLRIENQGVKQYRVCLTPDEGEAILGREVTIWSQHQLGFFSMVDYIYQIKLGDRLVNDYSKTKPNKETIIRTAPTVSVVLISLAVLPLLPIWWVNRKDTSAE